MPDGNDSLYCFNFLTQREYGVSFLPAVSRLSLTPIDIGDGFPEGFGCSGQAMYWPKQSNFYIN
jgi:hypothetical protein